MARYYAEVQVVIRMIAIWTGMLLMVSLFYLGEFDYSRNQVWIWFGAYIIYPLIALWMMWHDRTLHERFLVLACQPGFAVICWHRVLSSQHWPWYFC